MRKSPQDGGQMVIFSGKDPAVHGVSPSAWRLFTVLLAGVLLFWRPSVIRAETIVGELSLSHAAFLMSAARFTNWPAEAFENDTSPLVFCVYQDPETGLALQERQLGETIRGRSLKMVDIDTLQQLSQCHVVYLPAARIGEYPAGGQGIHGILSVSDCREFAVADGMLGFVRGDQGVDVFINVEVLNQSGLSISPSLLQMAELVKMGSAGSGTRTLDR